LSLENKVNILENNIKEIQIKLNEKPNIICEQKLNQLENKSNNNNNEFKKILELKDQINQLKSYILSPGEKLISIKFVSCDQNINFSTYVKANDNFTKIENILYNNYPNYREIENYFIANGKKINKYKTIEQNGIKDNDIITLNTIDA
jgi:hypothetical protein